MDGGDADAARTDASIGDSSIDPADDAGILPVVGVACGSTTCAIGEGCCLSSKSPVCTKHSACTGFFIACTAQSACGGGARCCFDGAQASCATSCAGKNPICASSGDCVQGQCAPLSCDVDASAPTTPLRLCWNDAATQLSRDGLTCSLP